jgi:hypothetical protein
MVALVAIGLWLLADLTADSSSVAVLLLAWLSRIATFVFLIYYTSLDSIGGSGLGRTILNTQMLADQGKLTADQVSGVAAVLNAKWIDLWVGGDGSFISLTGSWAAFAGALLVAVALFLDDKASWPPALLLTAFGWELQMSHTMPHGPIAFALLIIAGIWLRQANRRHAGS